MCTLREIYIVVSSCSDYKLSNTTCCVEYNTNIHVQEYDNGMVIRSACNRTTYHY